MKVSMFKEKTLVKSDLFKAPKLTALIQQKNFGQKNFLLKLKSFYSKVTPQLSRNRTVDLLMNKRKERLLIRQESSLIKQPITLLSNSMIKLQKKTRLFGVQILSWLNLIKRSLCLSFQVTYQSEKLSLRPYVLNLVQQLWEISLSLKPQIMLSFT